MRSDNVYRAMEHGRSRFEICQVVSKSVRRLHKPGTPFQDTINYTLVHMTASAPAPEVTPKKAALPISRAA